MTTQEHAEITLNLPQETLANLNRIAHAQGRTVQDLLEVQVTRILIEQATGMAPAGDESVTHVATGIDKSGGIGYTESSGTS